MTDKNYIYKKLSDGRYIKEIDSKTEHLASAEEDAKLATDIRSLLQGVQGESGTSGTSGQDGTSGRDGVEGKMGRTGLTGPRGLNGTSGSSGSSGQDGTSGVDGQNGTSGVNGRKGEKGDKGDRGFPGLQGPAGAKGQDGTIGSNGQSGTSGTSGTSAPGITSGTSGTSGISGSSGSSGTSGTSGSSGSSGTSGTSSTPVKISGIHGAGVVAGGSISAALITNAGKSTGGSFLANNRLWIQPFIPAKTFTMASISIEVTATGTAGQLYIKVYDDLNGTPNNFLFGSGALTGSIGIKTYTTSYQFVAGSLYWLGVNSNGSATMRAIGSAASYPLQSTAGTAVFAGATITQTATNNAYPGGSYTLQNLGTVEFTMVVTSVP